MFDAANARRLMVDGQVRTADVTDAALLEAMLTLPRERFLPPALAQLAYVDGDIPVAKGRALLKPMMLAKLVQAARIDPGDRVLDVACATGYSSAVLAGLSASVVALEEDPDLARQAREFVGGGRRHGGRSGHRAIERRLAGRRPLRRHYSQRRHRSRPRDIRLPAQAGRPPGRHLWPGAGV